MRIALTGAHGVGKTTLLESLEKRLSLTASVAVCREVPRVIIGAVGDDSFFRRGKNTPLRQLLILFYQVIEESLRDRDASLVLADRTVIDHLAYTVSLFPDLEATEEYGALFAAARSWLPQYDLIVKLPIEFSAVDDGVREADDGFQQAIDAAIDRLYAQMGISPVIVRGSVEERTARVMDLIRSDPNQPNPTSTAS